MTSAWLGSFLFVHTPHDLCILAQSALRVSGHFRHANSSASATHEAGQASPRALAHVAGHFRITSAWLGSFLFVHTPHDLCILAQSALRVFGHFRHANSSASATHEAGQASPRAFAHVAGHFRITSAWLGSSGFVHTPHSRSILAQSALRVSGHHRLDNSVASGTHEL